jgi:hypothetical protein
MVKKKCKDCNPCEDNTLRVGGPIPSPECDNPNPCSTFMSAACIVFDNLPGAPTLADLMNQYLENYPLPEEGETVPFDIVTNDDNLPQVDGISGGVAGNVLNNDTVDGQPVDLSTTTLTVTTPATPVSPGDPVPYLDVTTGQIIVPPNTPGGNYIITYSLCQNNLPGNCSSSDSGVAVLNVAPLG